MSIFFSPSLIGVLAIPFLAAPFAYLLRRSAFLASTFSIAAIFFTMSCIWRLPDGTMAHILGRELALYPIQRMALLILLFSTASIFLFVWQVSQGWSLYPFLLISIGFLNGALLFQSPVIAVLLAELGMLTCIFLIQGGPREDTRPAMHLLTTIVLASPLLLVAIFLLHYYDMHSDIAALLQVATAIMALGFAFVFALFPFHTWLPTISETAPPAIAAFMASTVPIVFLVLLTTWLVQFPALRETGTFSHLLVWGGLVTAITGGILAYSQDHLGRWWAHVALADLGYLLVGLGIASPAALHGVLYGLINRSVALILAGQSLAVLHHRATGLSPRNLQGTAFRLPVSLLGMSLGSLALLGVPISSGFLSRWLIYRALLENGYSVWVWGLLGATAFAGLGYARIIRSVFIYSERGAGIEREPRLASATILVLSVFLITLAMYPQLVAGPVRLVLAMLPFSQ